ncbi:MAG: phenylalanine--tRNA ligase subunit beta [cyanobacterium endosymbiont of Rhopalodia musculus]|uniref:phenylalanine--tRNA ligase subunit beta n=1 Tax=cyanobacterium endosymbiont of Epithemia clementina EcSB TaxID=3034674 RepID=UPI00248020EF|nr:phenylalanine--tRNA ligase subunit beta [cyanobacterium endosymbiont of Epithemia clementina EcSB]WGT66965.1 phenylalanine--tRNA ligase subunit beta [cyanobacterium endosymbiont of Epithemia clementina EcSB]
MKISVNWLRELVNITLSPEALADILTTAGLEVDQIEDRRQWANGVVIGKIIDCQPHPNADKLSICKVDIGRETYLNIVCGAPNVASDSIVPVATIGTYLPKIDLKIKPAKLRGVKSEGMICSLAEVGLSNKSAGIHIFEDDAPELGADARPLLGLDDVILDISPTANRADALSMVGIAREVAALTGEELNLPESPKVSFPKKSSYSLKVQVSDGNVCSAYMATVIENVRIAQSPKWLQNRLEVAGIRPINNVVDVTNLILLEWGQPLHAFDRDKLETVAKKTPLTLRVRFATEKETLKTLDKQERNLKSVNLVIAANDQPVALAGVMGGYETDVDDTTQNVVLEAALFDQLTIRRSSRCQSLRSESSARYERGINQSELEIACNLAIDLIAKLAEGTPVTQVIEDNRPDLSTESILLRLERIHQILGPIKKDGTTANVTAIDVERILVNLGCDLTPVKDRNNVWKVSVPSYRYQDLKREIDLIEEVARLYGYEYFCDELPDKTEPGGLSFDYQVQRKVREVLRAVGLTEVVQYSLVKPEKADIIITNPLFAEYAALRTNLLDGLIDAFTYNQSQGNGALNAFEIGRTFRIVEGKYREFDEVVGIMGGDMFPQGRWINSGKSVLMRWYEAKGILESVFVRLGLDVIYQPYDSDERLHPGRTASLWVGKKQLGIFGQLHPQLRQEKDLIDAVYAFTLNFNVLLETLGQEELINPVLSPFSIYPAVERDLAFFASLKVSVADLTQVMNKAGGNLLAGVELFDQYQGENVPEGERSLAFTLVYRADNRTLTDEDVEPVHDKIRNALVKKFEVTLRS